MLRADPSLYKVVFTTCDVRICVNPRFCGIPGARGVRVGAAGRYTGCLKEVAGDPAVIVEGRDPAAYVPALLSEDQDRREGLIALGMHRAEGYTWRRTAEQRRRCIAACSPHNDSNRRHTTLERAVPELAFLVRPPAVHSAGFGDATRVERSGLDLGKLQPARYGRGKAAPTPTVARTINRHSTRDVQTRRDLHETWCAVDRHGERETSVAPGA